MLPQYSDAASESAVEAAGIEARLRDQQPPDSHRPGLRVVGDLDLLDALAEQLDRGPGEDQLAAPASLLMMTVAEALSR